jgi:hypothetical protein
MGGATELPAYVAEAMRGLTAAQKRAVLDGCIHGDFSNADDQALLDKALFYIHPTTPRTADAVRCASHRWA